MKINLPILPTACAFAATCLVSAAAYYYKLRTAEINQVMIFCKLQYNPYNYFDKIMRYIDSAKSHVDVCMPGIHNPAIQGRLVKLARRKKIKIRFVIDSSGYKYSTEPFVNELMDAGAEIRFKLNVPAYEMQHKFCLIDDRILMSGTLNWGNDLSWNNWNYVYITSKEELVRPVQREFLKMWKSCSDDLWSSETTKPQLYESDNDGLRNEFIKYLDNCILKTKMEEEKMFTTVIKSSDLCREVNLLQTDLG